MFSECAELAIFLYVLFAIFGYLRRKRSDLDKKLLGIRLGKGWGGGGWGGLNTRATCHFRTARDPCGFFFWSVVQIHEKHNVDYFLNIGVSVVLMQIYEGKTTHFLFLVMFCLPDPFTLCMQSKETKECLTNCFP